MLVARVSKCAARLIVFSYLGGVEAFMCGRGLSAKVGGLDISYCCLEGSISISGTDCSEKLISI